MTGRPLVALINASTCLGDDAVLAMLPALQTQVTRDLAPAWSLDGADLEFLVTGQGGAAPSYAWWLVFLDNSDQADALGYHELTSQALPIGKVFAKTDQEYGQQVSVTASHELLEMLVDPHIDRTASVSFRGHKVKVAIEPGDPVEADRYAYDIGGIAVSDFVLPEFYGLAPFGAPKAFDLKGYVTQPMQILEEGYLSVNDGGGDGWTQVMGERISLPHLLAPPPGSRRFRRRLAEVEWRLSTAKP